MGRQHREPYLDELLPSEEELAAQRRAASTPGTDQAWGEGIGGVLGGAAGALGLLVPGIGPELAAATIPAGAKLGSMLGGGIGENIGQNAIAGDQAMLDEKALERARKKAAYEDRQAAIDQLLRQG